MGATPYGGLHPPDTATFFVKELHMDTPRPDPITPRVLSWTTLMAFLGILAGVAVDIGWELPESNNAMDWVRSILILLFAAGGVYVGAQKAKQDTTPTSDPQSQAGEPLYTLEAAERKLGRMNSPKPTRESPPRTEF